MTLRELFGLIAPSKLERVEPLDLRDALHDGDSSDAPLLVRLFSAIGTWIGAIMIAAVLFALELHEVPTLALVCSLALFAGGLLLARRQQSSLVSVQLIWALVMGSHGLLLGAALEQQASSVTTLLLWTALNLATALLIRLPSLQLISAALTVLSGALLADALELPMPGALVVLAAVGVATAAWMFELAWAARLGRTWAALAYGLPLGVIGTLIIASNEPRSGIAPGDPGATLTSFALLGILGLVLGRAKHEQGEAIDRRALLLGLGVALAGLAAHRVPGLGLALLWLVVAHLRKSTGLRIIALIQLAGFLFFFYYQLQTTLLLKSLWVLSTGAALLLAAWFARPLSASVKQPGEEPGEQPPGRRSRWQPAIVLVLLTAGIVTVGALSKARVIADGQTLLLPLVPVDPRSLMQGDYMVLAYALEQEIDQAAFHPTLPRHGTLVLTRDSDDIGHFARFDDGSELREGELRLEYRLRETGWGRLRLGAESFLFEEGSGELYEAAHFGELAVAASGTAVLIGLRDEHMQPLGRRMHSR